MNWFKLVLYCLFVAVCAAFAPIVTVVVTSTYLAYLRLARIHGAGLILPGAMAATAMLVAIRGLI
jgi:hypothetical protein